MRRWWRKLALNKQNKVTNFAGFICYNLICREEGSQNYLKRITGLFFFYFSFNPSYSEAREPSFPGAVIGYKIIVERTP